MAYIRKYGKRWRAEVQRDGKRRSKLFPTKREASDWAAREEYVIQNAPKVQAGLPLGDLFDRYAREVSPTKRGAKWEITRLELLKRDELADVRLGKVGEPDIVAWRDRRLRVVSPGTVIREMTLLSGVFSIARKEWRLIDHNPVSAVRRPSAPPPRDRLPTESEIERMAYVAGDDLGTAQGRAWHAFRFACLTAMRAGEIIGLEWSRINLEAQVAILPITKNGSQREVPLQKDAVALLEMLPRTDPVFGLTSAQLDALWRKVRDKAGVEGLTFHDSRAYALTVLSRRVDVMTLARISGHRDLRLLLSTYYRESAEDIAKRLN